MYAELQEAGELRVQASLDVCKCLVGGDFCCVNQRRMTDGGGTDTVIFTHFIKPITRSGLGCIANPPALRQSRTIITASSTWRRDNNNTAFQGDDQIYDNVLKLILSLFPSAGFYQNVFST